MSARLSILNGDFKGQEFILHEGANTIGRRSDNHIVIQHPTISRYHAVLDLRGAQAHLRKVTDQGTLKVDGTDIEAVDLGGEHRIQLGKLLLQFKPYSELPAAVSQALQPTPFMDTHEETVDLSVSLAPQNGLEETKVKEQEALKKFSYKRILQVMAILILGVMAWKVLSSVKPEDVDTINLPYKAGEEKLIDLDGYLRSKNISKLPVNLSLDHPDILQARMEPPPLSIMWFKATEQGECTVTLLDQAQDPLLKFKFIIRGALESRAEVFRRENLSDEERSNTAKKLMKKGSLIAKENPYEAFDYFDRALTYIEGVSSLSSQYFECRRQMEEPQKAVDARIKFLWAEANSYRKNKDYATALQFIEQILSLVKHPSNLDHQRAQIHKKYVQRHLKK